MRTLAILLSLALSLYAPLSSAADVFGLATNIGLGYGVGKQEFGDDHTFEPKSVAGHVDVQFLIWKLILGGSYLSLTNLNVGEDRNYVGMGAAHVGFNLSNSIQLLYGIGAGSWRRARSNQLTTPSDYDYKATGGGTMAGIRIFLINTKQVSVGLSATYYEMTSNSYKSVEDNVKSEVTEESKGTGSIAAIVVRLNGFDFRKGAKR